MCGDRQRLLSLNYWQIPTISKVSIRAYELYGDRECSPYMVWIYVSWVWPEWSPVVSEVLWLYPYQLLASVDKTLLTENHNLLTRWKVHFRTLFNNLSIVEIHATESIAHSRTQQWMDECPDQNEVITANGTLCDGKSPGADGLHPEVIKRGGSKLVKVPYSMIEGAWTNMEIPSGWNDAQLVTIFKKGDRRICGNYRGISLLYTTGKVFVAYHWTDFQLMLRISYLAQCGFCVGRGEVDIIFCQTNTGEIYRREPVSIHGLCRFYYSLRHS